MSEPTEPRPMRRGTIALCFVLDVIFVTTFAAIGRASHGEQTFAGLWQTAWPFLTALVVGWVVTLAWRAPAAPVRTGLGVWAVTVVGGMVLRLGSGQGIAPAFIVVAAAVLLLFLVGWRLIAAWVHRRRMARPASP